ncbi:TolC family protein [Mucilaginibacter psychrotolerans]|uniref:TolC family protein n=1 Tax=Mucilaginibacter psychrotolerans TaxID=1524096 RepID=A0A4Y8SC08_9SPHI|nr:TolC family protein [Mucilaginibacter psychrotolerans]TFF36127.1 TolC family protein [Mucilaginibacter psychrotolerans]
MTFKKSFSFLILLFSVNYTYCQSALTLSLKDAIHLSQINSLDYKISVNTARSAFWNYKNYKSSFLPKLSLSGYTPDYYRSINSITLPSGQISFVGQNVANSSLFLNFAQNIGLTGGNIAIGSSLSRLDNFGNYNNTSYTSIPFTLSYFQDNLFYNDFKWQKQIEPLKLQEARRGYVENLENISLNTVSQYFDLLLANIQLKLDQQNLKNIDTLVKITKARSEIGTVQLNEVLQSKVSLLNAKSALANSTLNVETAQQSLIRYLNIDKSQLIELTIPDSITQFEIARGAALEQAHYNRKYIVEFKRRRLEAEQALSRTKSETGPKISIRANIGLTQTGGTLGQSYRDLLMNQSVTVGINIPIIDWGVNRSNRKRAEANLELEKNNIAQQELAAEQEINYQIMKWEMQNNQISISKEVRTLAQQRYDIARQKYALGSITYTDFNNAQLEKDRAITDYINNLRNYWSMYYLIRRLTLYDFERNKKIDLIDFSKDADW